MSCLQNHLSKLISYHDIMNSADSITMSDNHEKTALAVALGDEN